MPPTVDTLWQRMLRCDSQDPIWPNRDRFVARTIDRTLHDCLYLALAVRLNTRMLTADSRFVVGLAHLPLLARHVELIQAFKG